MCAISLEKLVCCLCAGADSDWHNLEFVTCWENDAQTMEKVRGVKIRHDIPASYPIKLLVVQLNNNKCVCLFEKITLSK